MKEFLAGIFFSLQERLGDESLSIRLWSLRPRLRLLGYVRMLEFTGQRRPARSMVGRPAHHLSLGLWPTRGRLPLLDSVYQNSHSILSHVWKFDPSSYDRPSKVAIVSHLVVWLLGRSILGLARRQTQTLPLWLLRRDISR